MSATPAPTTTGASVASATGLVIGQGIGIVVAGVKYVRGDRRRHARMTWAPGVAEHRLRVRDGGRTYAPTSSMHLAMLGALPPTRCCRKIIKGFVAGSWASRSQWNADCERQAAQTVTPTSGAFTAVGAERRRADGRTCVGDPPTSSSSWTRIDTGVVLRQHV